MNSYLYSYLILISITSAFGCLNTKSTTGKLEDFGTVGEFSFLERNGEQISQENLKGKVWLASFVFTRCTGPCPQVCATLARLQEKLKDVPDLRIVTFTVDPERDNPKELNLFAENFRADPKRWFFLTGKEENLHQLIKEKFHLAVGHNSPEQSKPGNEFIHSPRIVLIDKVGHIRVILKVHPPPLKVPLLINLKIKSMPLNLIFLHLQGRNKTVDFLNQFICPGWNASLNALAGCLIIAGF